MKLLLVILMLSATLFAYEGHHRWVGVFAKPASFTTESLQSAGRWKDFRPLVTLTYGW